MINFKDYADLKIPCLVEDTEHGGYYVSNLKVESKIIFLCCLNNERFKNEFEEKLGKSIDEYNFDVSSLKAEIEINNEMSNSGAIITLKVIIDGEKVNIRIWNENSNGILTFTNNGKKVTKSNIKEYGYNEEFEILLKTLEENNDEDLDTDGLKEWGLSLMSKGYMMIK